MAHVRTRQPKQPDIRIRDHKEPIRPVSKTDAEGRQIEQGAGQQTASPNRIVSSPHPEEKGFRIAGFPWQFVFVMGVVGLVVLAFIIKMVVGF